MPQPPDRLFHQRGQKEDYLAWMRDHPHGFVLNWPRTGRNADGNLVFHRSGCRVLRQRSFPTPTYHKVCMSSLRALTEWAVQKREFPEAPGHHACDKCFEGGEEEFARVLRDEEQLPAAVDQEAPGRVETQVLRIVRDTALACRIKRLHGGKCQLCGTTIRLYDGRYYAEAHHLKPLGGEHRGPDVEGNIVCICPTCHAKLDYGVIPLSMDDLAHLRGHQVGPEFIAYHNEHVYRAPIAG